MSEIPVTLRGIGDCRHENTPQLRSMFSMPPFRRISLLATESHERPLECLCGQELAIPRSPTEIQERFRVWPGAIEFVPWIDRHVEQRSELSESTEPATVRRKGLDYHCRCHLVLNRPSITAEAVVQKLVMNLVRQRQSQSKQLTKCKRVVLAFLGRHFATSYRVVRRTAHLPYLRW